MKNVKRIDSPSITRKGTPITQSSKQKYVSNQLSKRQYNKLTNVISSRIQAEMEIYKRVAIQVLEEKRKLKNNRKALRMAMCYIEKHFIDK